MTEVAGWVILNFFTSFLLILLIIFQNKTSRIQSGRRYSSILILTLVLILSESIGHVGELYPDKCFILMRIGYFMIFFLDPLDILFAINYIDCWMDDKKLRERIAFRFLFQVFATVNALFVVVSEVFQLKWFYYFDGYEYVRGPYFYVRAILLMIFIALLMVYVIVFRSSIVNEYKNNILFLPSFALIGSLLQIFFANLDTTYAGISLGCLILFFYFQSKDINVDYLSGLLNRRGIDIKLQEMTRISVAYNYDFTAIMMDLDNFKELNDTFGHEEGDRAIKRVAEALVLTFGDKCQIGRFGGDEFCVLTTETSQSVIAHKVELFRRELETIRKKNGWAKNFGVSCGYCLYDHKEGLSASDFQKKIDELMYEEKKKHHLQMQI